MIIILVDLATDNDNNTKSGNNGYTDSQTYVCIYIYIRKYIIYIYDLTITIPIILRVIAVV